MIEAKAISVVFGDKPILRDLSVSIGAGEMVGILGPNGSGKSTLIRTLAGLIKPDRGSVALDSRPMGIIPPKQVARVLAVVGQSGGYVQAMTVEQHVALGRHPHRSRWSFLAANDLKDTAAIEEALRVCDIAALRYRTVETLSGGERQRVRLATALAQQPRVLLLDEPLTGLDIEHQLELLSLLRRLNTELGLTVLVVIHDLDHAARFFPRVVLLRNGQIAADGAPTTILHASSFESVFRVDGCLSRDRLRDQPVVVCSRLCDRTERDQAVSTQAPPVVVTRPLHSGLALLARSIRSSRMSSDASPRQPATETPETLGSMLKSRTHDQHDAAEKHPFHAVLFGTEGQARARDAYIRSLGQHLHVQETFEPLLRRAANESYTFRSLVRPYHFHLAALREDLSALDAAPEQIRVLPATARFVSHIEACASHDGCALLGVWYVFEGSTNGGTIIAKRVRELLVLPTDAGTKFINPHGPLVRARWGEWKSTLDALEFDMPHRLAIVNAAQETFNAISNVMTAVHDMMNSGSEPMPAAPALDVSVLAGARATQEMTPH